MVAYAGIHRPLNRSNFLKGQAGIQGPLNRSEFLNRDAGIRGPLNRSEFLKGMQGSTNRGISSDF